MGGDLFGKLTWTEDYLDNWCVTPWCDSQLLVAQKMTNSKTERMNAGETSYRSIGNVFGTPRCAYDFGTPRGENTVVRKPPHKHHI